MNIQVITLGLYPTLDEAHRRTWIFRASCAKHSIEPCYFGIGELWRYHEWSVMKIDYQLEYLRSDATKDATHILYTDSLDAVFFAGLDEIQAKYEALGSPPMLVSAHNAIAGREWGVDYDAVFPKDCGPFRVPYVGGYLGERDAAVAAFEMLAATPLRLNQRKDDVFVWWNAWEAGWRPALDSTCQIFQAGSAGLAEDTDRSGRIYNLITGSYPCVPHFQGNYQDNQAVRGWKDYMMEPFARKWGIL
jgi:hypothetical protein